MKQYMGGTTTQENQEMVDKMIAEANTQLQFFELNNDAKKHFKLMLDTSDRLFEQTYGESREVLMKREKARFDTIEMLKRDHTGRFAEIETQTDGQLNLLENSLAMRKKILENQQGNDKELSLFKTKEAQESYFNKVYELERGISEFPNAHGELAKIKQELD